MLPLTSDVVVSLLVCPDSDTNILSKQTFVVDVMKFQVFLGHSTDENVTYEVTANFDS